MKLDSTLASRGIKRGIGGTHAPRAARFYLTPPVVPEISNTEFLLYAAAMAFSVEVRIEKT